jgi:hypothetical protein
VPVLLKSAPNQDFLQSHQPLGFWPCKDKLP